MSQVERLELRALRRNNPPGAEDGDCGEFLNLRYRQGAFRAVGPKVQLYAKPDFTESFIHKLYDQDKWIGYRESDNGIYSYDPATLDETLLGTIEGTYYDFRSLKNYLIVTTSTKLMVWLWQDGEYQRINMDSLDKLINVEVTTDAANTSDYNYPESDSDYARGDTNNGVVDEDQRDLAAAELIGLYYKRLAEISADGQMTGAFMWRVAVKLFDGSYVYHTPPRFFMPFGYMVMATKKKGTDWMGLAFMNGGAGILARAVIGDAAYEALKTIASSIEIYFSKQVMPFDVTEDTVTGDYFNNVYVDLVNPHPNDWPDYGDPIRDYFSISDDFRKMANAELFYLVGSLSFDSLTTGAGDHTGDFTMDLVDFYSNYASRKKMTVGGYSQYTVFGRVSYVYNNRLIMGDVTQKLTGGRVYEVRDRSNGLDNIKPIIGGATEYSLGNTVDVMVVTYLKTSSGQKTAVYTISKDDDNPIHEWGDPGNALKKAILLDGVLGYYDARATKMEIYVSRDSQATWYKVGSIALQASDYFNYAFKAALDFSTDGEHTPGNGIYDNAKPFTQNYAGTNLVYLTSDATVVPPTGDSDVNEANLRIISEVTNPFVYDSANYQEVSTGTILAFGSNTDPVSQSQFGEYPLYTMTSLGIWAGAIGTGSVFIVSDVPVNGEVILNRRAKADLSVGMVYAAEGGLRYLSGRKPLDVSDPVEGHPDYDLINSEDMAKILNNTVLGDYTPYVDTVQFREYLQDAVIGSGIDRNTKVNGDVFVANPNYDYIYVFDPTASMWYKIPGKVSTFINNYPELYAMGENYILNMSAEQDDANSPVIFITRPLALQGDEAFKKMRRTFMRCMMKTAGNSHCALVRLVSDDLVNWSIDTGNDNNAGVFKDIWITHSFESKRYVVYAFVGTLNVGVSILNFIKGLDLEIDYKWNPKIR